MNQSRTAILVGFVVIVAFIAGYKGETLAEYLSIERVRGLFSAVSGSLFKPDANPSGSASGGASSLAGASTLSNLPGGMPNQLGGMVSSGPMMNPGMIPGMAAPGARAGIQYSSIPYRPLNHPMAAPDNAPGDSAPSEGGMPKNAYFEKLSEQMRELRQQNMVQTFSVPSQPSGEPSPPTQMYSSTPGMMAPEHFPMEAPPPSMMPAPGDFEGGMPVMPLPEESEELEPPEILMPNMEE